MLHGSSLRSVTKKTSLLYFRNERRPSTNIVLEVTLQPPGTSSSLIWYAFVGLSYSQQTTQTVVEEDWTPNPRKQSFIASHLRIKEGFSSIYPWRRKSVNYNPPTAGSTTRIETIWVKLRLDKLHLFLFLILHVAHALSLNPSY